MKKIICTAVLFLLVLTIFSCGEGRCVIVGDGEAKAEFVESAGEFNESEFSRLGKKAVSAVSGDKITVNLSYEPDSVNVTRYRIDGGCEIIDEDEIKVSVGGYSVSFYVSGDDLGIIGYNVQYLIEEDILNLTFVIDIE